MNQIKKTLLYLNQKFLELILCMNYQLSLIRKAKTCRMMVDGARRVDESFTSDETDGMFEVYEKIKPMAMRDCECDKKKDSVISSEEPPYRLKITKKNSFPSVIHK